MLGPTEVAVSVSVLLTATDELAGNITVNQTFLSSLPCSFRCIIKSR